MKIGIAGFAGCGKSTVFHWLTEQVPDPSRSMQGQLGEARIDDPRLDWLSRHFRPKKTTPARLQFLDTPGLLVAERRDNPRRLGILRDADALLVILNGFADGDLTGELQNFREELLFADMQVVSGRVDRLEEQLRKPRPTSQKEADQRELSLLHRLLTALEQGQRAGGIGLADDEEKAVRSFQLLTLKRELVLINIGDKQIGTPVPPHLAALTQNPLQAAAKLELELHELPEEDRSIFMEDLQLTEFSRNDVLRTIFAEMGNIVFFTVGDDECRAWPVCKGTTAVEGAADIHTDLARGFVRGEVVRFDDFRKVGSMKEAKARGVYRLEGKTYVIEDGDILHILASA